MKKSFKQFLRENIDPTLHIATAREKALKMMAQRAEYYKDNIAKAAKHPFVSAIDLNNDEIMLLSFISNIPHNISSAQFTHLCDLTFKSGFLKHKNMTIEYCSNPCESKDWKPYCQTEQIPVWTWQQFAHDIIEGDRRDQEEFGTDEMQ